MKTKHLSVILLLCSIFHICSMEKIENAPLSFTVLPTELVIDIMLYASEGTPDLDQSLVRPFTLALTHKNCLEIWNDKYFQEKLAQKLWSESKLCQSDKPKCYPYTIISLSDIERNILWEKNQIQPLCTKHDHKKIESVLNIIKNVDSLRNAALLARSLSNLNLSWYIEHKAASLVDTNSTIYLTPHVLPCLMENDDTNDTRTPFIYAISKGLCTTVEHFIKTNAHLNDPINKTSVLIPAYTKNKKIIDCVSHEKKHRITLEYPEEVILDIYYFRLYEKGNVNEFESYVKRKARMTKSQSLFSYVFLFENKFLMEAIKIRDLKMVKYLRKHGITIVNNENNPLIHAIKAGDFEIFKYLVDSGIEINSQYKTNQTPLTEAIRLENPAMANYLLARGADIYVSTVIDDDDNQYTPFEWAQKMIGAELGSPAKEEIISEILRIHKKQQKKCSIM